jgi:hypothetical protein
MSNTHTMLNTNWPTSSEMLDHVREQVSRTLRELEFAARGCAKSYRKPYPEFFDSVPYPRGFRVLDFVKFTREDSRTTYEHVGQYLAQVSDVGINDMHRVKFFPLSLTGIALNWFTSLAPNSINTWS